jgi:hypothetical protein
MRVSVCKLADVGETPAVRGGSGGETTAWIGLTQPGPRSRSLGATERQLSRYNGVKRGQKIACGACFHDVAPGAQFLSFSHHILRGFLSQKDDFGFRDELTNFLGGRDSVEIGEADIQQDQVWPQVCGFVNRFEPVGHFADDLESAAGLEHFRDELPEGREILDD